MTDDSTVASADETPTPVARNPNHGPWIVAAAVVLAALLIVAAMLYVNGRTDASVRCPQIQEEAIDLLLTASVAEDANVGEMGALLEEWDSLGYTGDFLDVS